MDDTGYLQVETGGRFGLVPAKYLFPVAMRTVNSIAEAEVVSTRALWKMIGLISNITIIQSFWLSQCNVTQLDCTI